MIKDYAKNNKSDNFHSEDAFKDYLIEISNYPKLPKEEINRLYDLYKKGDLVARDKIYNSHLRFVVKIAKKYFKILNISDYIDVVQEGNLGLLRALEDFDYTKGAFTTYSFHWIKSYVKNAVNEIVDTIKKPIRVKELAYKYKLLLADAEAKGITLTEEEICEKLDISPVGLSNLLESFQTNTISINSKISNEDEFETYLGEEDQEMELIPSKIDNNNRLSVIKLALSDLEYYIFYYRVINNPQYTLEKVSLSLNVSKERIRQLENKTFRKVKLLLNKKTSFNNKIQEIRSLKRIINTNPITPIMIIIYNYLSEFINDKSKIVLYNYLFNKYVEDEEKDAKTLDIDLSEYKVLLDDIKIKIKNSLSSEDFTKYKKQFLDKYKGTIYKDEFVHDIDYVDIDYLKEKYSEYSYLELINLFEENNIYVPKDIITLLYYLNKKNNNQNISKEELEKHINILYLGYNSSSQNLSTEILKSTYINNMDKFTKEEILYVDCCLFKNKDKELIKNYNYKEYERIIRKIEKYYYKIYDYLEIDYNKYLLIKELYLEDFTKEEIELLDEFYKVKDINILNQKYNMNIDKLVDLVNTSINKLDYIYVTNKDFIELDKKKYKEQVIGYNNIIEKYINGTSFKELVSQYNLTNKELLEILKKEIYLLDRKRFNLYPGIKIDNNHFKDILSEDIYYDIDKLILRYLYQERINKEKIAKTLNISIDYINSVNEKFNKLYLERITTNFNIYNKDIIDEYLSHNSQNILTNEEKELVKLYYIENNNKLVIASKLDIDYQELEDKYNLIKMKIKAQKYNLYQSNLSFIVRYEAVKLASDDNNILTKEEKEILKYLYEIDKYKFKTLEELANMYNISLEDMEEKYYKIVIKVYKVKNKEINYKYLIANNINKLNNKEINIIKEYLTNNSKNDLIGIILYKLYLLSKNINVNLYHIKDNIENLPYNGDIKLIKNIIDEYQNNYYELSKKYNIPNLYDLVTNYLLSICKYKNGIRKSKSFTKEEILTYYNSNKDKLSNERLEEYQEYLNTGEITNNILYDLIKEHDSNVVYLDNLNLEELIYIIIRIKSDLPAKVYEQIKYLYNLNDNDFVNKKTQLELYKLLNKLDKRIKDNKTMLLK